MDLQKLSIEIADHLFTNGAGQKANRLILELPNGKHGGGWCQEAVEDAVYSVLRKKLPVDKSADSMNLSA